MLTKYTLEQWVIEKCIEMYLRFAIFSNIIFILRLIVIDIWETIFIFPAYYLSHLTLNHHHINAITLTD
jgi:hypothetical protein